MIDIQWGTIANEYESEFDALTFDFRFILDFNGRILAINENAVSMFGGEQEFFYDLFFINTRNSVMDYMNRIQKTNGWVEEKFLQLVSREAINFRYRGVLKGDVILVVGQIIEKSRTLPEDFYSALNRGMFVLNEKREISYCSHLFCEWFHIKSRDQWIGQPFKNLSVVHPVLEFMESVVCELESLQSDVQRYFYNENFFYMMKATYHKTTLSISFVVDKVKAPKDLGNLLFSTKQMENVSQLASGFAHELRNPLAVIKGFIQLASLSDDMPKYYDTIMSELNRMNHTIEDFLSVSRKKMKTETCKPHDLVASILHIIRSECLLHDIIFEYKIEQAVHSVNINESMIKQVVLNVLRNAIEAYEGIEKNRYLSMDTFVKNHQYIIRVEDHGSGMTREVLKQLGKPFFTTKEKGNGIGIPLCKKMMKDHHGDFHIDSELGKGTTVVLTLPLEK